jgi:hypothetical protein
MIGPSRPAAEIIRRIAAAHSVPVDAIKGKARSRKIMAARIAIAKQLATECGMTSGQIASRLNRSAWTVRYYLNPETRAKSIRRCLSRWHLHHASRKAVPLMMSEAA